MTSNEILRLQHVQPLLDIVGCLQHHGYRGQALSQQQRLLLQQHGYSMVVPTLEGLHSIESRVEFCQESFFGDIYDAIVKAIQWCIDLIKDLAVAVRKMFIRTETELFLDNFNKVTELLAHRGDKSINPELDHPISPKAAAAFPVIFSATLSPWAGLYQRQMDAKNINIDGKSLVAAILGEINKNFNAADPGNTNLFGGAAELHKCFVYTVDANTGLFTNFSVDIQPILSSGTPTFIEAGWDLVHDRSLFIKNYTYSRKTLDDATVVLDKIRTILETDKAKIKGADSAEMKAVLDKLSGVNTFALLLSAAHRTVLSVEREVNKINVAALKAAVAAHRSALDGK